jgi:hypothetical protein
MHVAESSDGTVFKAWQKLNSRFEAYYSSIDESSKSGEVLSTKAARSPNFICFFLQPSSECCLK